MSAKVGPSPWLFGLYGVGGAPRVISDLPCHMEDFADLRRAGDLARVGVGPAVGHGDLGDGVELVFADADVAQPAGLAEIGDQLGDGVRRVHAGAAGDRKSNRLDSSH